MTSLALARWLLLSVKISLKQRFIDLVVFMELFLLRRYEIDYRNSVVVDIGAHKGYFLAYALLNGAAVVFAFEHQGKQAAELAMMLESAIPRTGAKARITA